MITVVTTRKGKSNFYTIELSDGEKLRVSEDLLVRHRLLKGTELTEETVKEIKASANYDLGLQMVMNYLSYQLRSEKDVRTYLKEKEIPLEDRNRIIDRLKDLKLVDDKTYGESYLRTQIRTSDKGPIVVRQQLRQKGLKDDLIDQILPIYTVEQQFDVAYHTAEKNLRRIHNKSFKETLQKVRLTLMQKGFTNEIIDLVMSELPLEKDEESEYEALAKEGERIWRRHQRKKIGERKMKVKQTLFQKGYASDLIARFIEEKELADEE